MATKSSKKITKVTTKSAAPRKAATKKKPKLLTGGNPQIPLGYGDAPVQTYIAAMPGWKSDIGRKLDKLIEKCVPNVSKAVKWNTPFYGIGDEGWFMAYSCVTKYVKIAFFQGTSLDPMPPVSSKQKTVRYFHIFEGDEIDSGQLSSWIKQASGLPLQKM